MAASLQSINPVRGIAGKGPGALPDRKPTAVTVGYGRREMLTRWPWAQFRLSEGGAATVFVGLNGEDRGR